MRRASGFSTGALAFACASALTGCDRHAAHEGAGPTPVAAKPALAASRTAAVPPVVPPTTQAADPLDSLSVSELPEESAAPAPSAGTAQAASRIVIDDAVAIGPAGQMTA